MNGAALAWLIGLPLATAPAAYLAGRLWAMAPGAAHRRRGPLLPRWLALAALAAAWAPLVAAARAVIASGPATVLVGAIALRVDALSVLVAGLALALGALAVLFSGPDIAGAPGEEKYYAIVVTLVGALVGLACAGDLFNLWVWFELMTVASYLLVCFDHSDPATLEAGVKYLVQSAAASSLVVVGIALALAQTGTLDLGAIRAGAGRSPWLLAAGALLVVGFGVKAALVPLHTWLPDAHAQAPSGISALLSGVVIKAGLVALLRVLGALAGVTPGWGPLLIAFGALNILAGNLLALRQARVKRLLACSSVGHVGYILLGLGIGIDAGQAAAIQGGLFHLATHGLMSGLAFLAAGALRASLGAAPGEHSPLTASGLAGAAGRYPLAALALSLALLGLGGLPPLAGFMSKWQIFAAGFATRSPAAMGLVVFAALNSVLSLAYYAPLVNALYRTEMTPALRHGAPMPLAMRAPLAVLALAVVVLGVAPGLASPLTEPAAAAVLALFRGGGP